jgi:hypothetical protein
VRAQVAFVAMVLASHGASACPLCHTETGRAVRSGIFDGRFVPTLLEVIAPFPILAAVAAFLHGTPRDRR